jgi:hypothetical protein
MTPRERRDLPWIVARGVMLCLVVIAVAAFYGGI